MSSTETKQIQTQIDEMESLTELLATELKKDSSKLELPEFLVDGPWRTRLVEYKQNGCANFILELSCLIIRVWRNSELSWPDETKIIVDGLRKIDSSISLEPNDNFDLLSISDIIETINEAAEILALGCIILDAFSFLLKKMNAAGSKKKKKVVGFKDAEIEEHFSLLIGSMIASLLKVETSLQNFTYTVNVKYPNVWDGKLEPMWRDKVPPKISEKILMKHLPTVLTSMRSSYSKSVAYLSFLASSRVEYLRVIESSAKS